MGKENDAYYVEALGRGLRILQSFADGPTYLSLAEICRRVNVHRGTTFRLLKTLEQDGYICQDPETKKYHLSVKVLDLQQPALNALDMRNRAMPVIERRSEQLGESVNIGVLEDDQIRFIARIPARRLMSINLQVGSKLPAHATSIGKVLLAQLSREEVRRIYGSKTLARFTDRTIVDLKNLLDELEYVRLQGWAITNEELEVGLLSIAAPIYDRHSRAIAAINLPVFSGRTAMEQLIDEFLPILLDSAREISESLGYQPEG